VADHVREALIASRGRTEDCPWKPEMIIDENKITHGFNEDLSKATFTSFGVMLTKPRTQ
jgi:hypothetical protein